MTYPSAERIKELCNQALTAKTQEDAARIAAELRAAIQEHTLLVGQTLKDQASLLAFLDKLAKS